MVPTPKFYKAVYKYEKREPDEIALQEGDLLYLVKKEEEDWWYGFNLTTGDKGIFPARYCAVFSLQAKTKFQFAGRDEEELSFQAGESLEIVDIEEEGWWRVRLKNKVGVAPKDYLAVSKSIELSVENLLECHQDVFTHNMEDRRAPSTALQMVEMTRAGGGNARTQEIEDHLPLGSESSPGDSSRASVVDQPRRSKLSADANAAIAFFSIPTTVPSQQVVHSSVDTVRGDASRTTPHIDGQAENNAESNTDQVDAAPPPSPSQATPHCLKQKNEVQAAILIREEEKHESGGAEEEDISPPEDWEDPSELKQLVSEKQKRRASSMSIGSGIPIQTFTKNKEDKVDGFLDNSSFCPTGPRQQQQLSNEPMTSLEKDIGSKDGTRYGSPGSMSRGGIPTSSKGVDRESLTAAPHCGKRSPTRDEVLDASETVRILFAAETRKNRLRFLKKYAYADKKSPFLGTPPNFHGTKVLAREDSRGPTEGETPGLSNRAILSRDRNARYTPEHGTEKHIQADTQTMKLPDINLSKADVEKKSREYRQKLLKKYQPPEQLIKSKKEALAPAIGQSSLLAKVKLTKPTYLTEVTRRSSGPQRLPEPKGQPLPKREVSRGLGEDENVTTSSALSCEPKGKRSVDSKTGPSNEKGRTDTKPSQPEFFEATDLVKSQDCAARKPNSEYASAAKKTLRPELLDTAELLANQNKCKDAPAAQRELPAGPLIDVLPPLSRITDSSSEGLGLQFGTEMGADEWWPERERLRVTQNDEQGDNFSTPRSAMDVSSFFVGSVEDSAGSEQVGTKPALPDGRREEGTSGYISGLETSSAACPEQQHAKSVRKTVLLSLMMAKEFGADIEIPLFDTSSERDSKEGDWATGAQEEAEEERLMNYVLDIENDLSIVKLRGHKKRVLPRVRTAEGPRPSVAAVDVDL